MEEHLKSNYFAQPEDDTVDFDIIIDIIPKYTTEEVKAAMYKGSEIPDGQVISGIKSAIITDQIEADYHAFIESVEDLLTEYYGLELFNTNISPDQSHYYAFFAKDKNSGKMNFKFKLELRISDHDPHRFKASQPHKKEDTETEKYRELTKEISKDSRPYSMIITVNSETYDSYETAFIDIDKNVEHYIDVMTKQLI